MTIDKGDLITLKIRDLNGILQGVNPSNNLFTYQDNVTVEQFVKDASDRFKTLPGKFELVYQDLQRGEIYELSKLPPKEHLTMIHITPSREKQYPFSVEKRKGMSNKAVIVETDHDDNDLPRRNNTANLEGAASVNGVNDPDIETCPFDRHKLSRFQANITIDEVLSCGREFVGLKNMTMTCYLNSLIQTLFFTPEFRNAVYMHNATDKTTENKSIALALQKVFLQMQFSVRSSIETDDLTKTFGWRDNEIWMQQDVEELYRLLMDYLSEELKGSLLDGVVPSLFGGIMNDYVECMECHKRNSKEELFLALPLPVRIFGKPLNAPTLEEALQAFVAPEILDGNNQYKCEQCQKPCDAKKGLSFKKFPYILTVTLNRFEFNWRSMTKHKLNDEIVFPMTLDMSKMLDPESLNAPDDGKRVPLLQEKLFKVDRTKEQSQVHSRANVDMKQILKNKVEETKLTKEKDDPEVGKSDEVTGEEGAAEALPPPEGATTNAVNPGNESDNAANPINHNTYQLYAVLIHRGGVNGGHYFAFIQDFETGQWYRCDDTIVRRISVEEISRTYGGIDITSDTTSEGGVAYILVYRRQDEKYNSLPMTYDLLPPRMKAMWDGMKEADQKCYEREELERNTIKIFVGTRNPGDIELKNIKEMIIQRSATMKEAAMQCYKEFYPNMEIEQDRVRLVRGDKNLNIIENSFDGKDDEIICVAVKRPMPITDAEGFLLEVRKPEESFESYHQNDIIIFAHIVPENVNVIESSTEIHVAPNATVAEIRAKILVKLHLSDACVIAVYGNGESAKQENLPVKLLTSASEESMIETLRVTKILNVYVRATKDDAQVREFLMLTSFWVTSTDIQVNFALPEIKEANANALQVASGDPLSKASPTVSPPVTNGDTSDVQVSTYKHQVILDQVSEDKKLRGLKLKVAKSISLKEVSCIISQIVGVDEDNFILYKNYADSETELLDFLEENNKLEDCLPFDELRCRPGRRVKAGEGRVKIFLLNMATLPLVSEPSVFKSIIVNPDMPGLEVRKIIGDLMEPKLTEEDLAKYILRRKITRGPSRIVKDDENLGTVARKLHDTEFYFQLANIPADCAEGYHSIFIRQWNHATSTLAEPQEIFIPQDYTLPAHELVLAKLSEVLELPSEQIQVANPESFGNFPYNLPMDVIRDRLHWFAIITRPRAIYIYNDELFLFTRNKTQVANAPPLPESESTGYEDEGVSVRSSKRETGLIINLARSPPT